MQIRHKIQYQTQRGAALVVSLMMLIAITLIGVGAMNGSILELNMATNARLQSDAMTRVENTLRAGEQSIGAWIGQDATSARDYDFTNFAGDGNNPFYSMVSTTTGGARPVPNWNQLADEDTWNSLSAVDPLPGDGLDDRYIVEYVGCHDVPNSDGMSDCADPDALRVDVYRVSAMSKEHQGALRMAQSTYVVINYATNPSEPLPHGLLVGGRRLAWADLTP